MSQLLKPSSANLRVLCTWQLFLQVLVVLVAKLVRSYEGASLGVAWFLFSLLPLSFRSRGRIPMYCEVRAAVSSQGVRVDRLVVRIPASGGHIPVERWLAQSRATFPNQAIRTFSPMLRRLRRVLGMVDIVLRVEWIDQWEHRDVVIVKTEME